METEENKSNDKHNKSLLPTKVPIPINKQKLVAKYDTEPWPDWFKFQIKVNQFVMKTFEHKIQFISDKVYSLNHSLSYKKKN